jgi:hypothetical protein
MKFLIPFLLLAGSLFADVADIAGTYVTKQNAIIELSKSGKVVLNGKKMKTVKEVEEGQFIVHFLKKSYRLHKVKDGLKQYSKNGKQPMKGFWHKVD